MAKSKIKVGKNSEEILVFISELDKDEKKQYDDIKKNIGSLKSESEQLSYLYNCLADYYANLKPQILYSSAMVVNQLPNIGAIGLDRKIHAEIDRIKNLQFVKVTTQFTPNFKGFELGDDGKPIFDTVELADDDKQKRICFLHSIGVIKFLKEKYQAQSNSTVAGFLTDILKIKKNTISKYLDGIDNNNLLNKFSKEIRDYKKERKLEID